MDYEPVLLPFEFDDFANICSFVDHVELSSSLLDCNGHAWHLRLFPGGRSEEDDEGWIGLELHKEFDDYLGARFTMSVKNADGETVEERGGYAWGFDDEYEDGNYTYSIDSDGEDDDGDAYVIDVANFMKRSTILDADSNILKEGALHIDVFIQLKNNVNVSMKFKRNSRFFEPFETPVHQNKMLQLLENEDKADITINIDGEVFHVHSLILDNNAPTLAKYCKQNDGSNQAIRDMDPVVFRIVLKNAYSGYRPNDNDISATGKDLLIFGRELIDAANRFELTELKDSVETALVRERVLNRENVLDYLLFADAQSCSLFKEYAISVFIPFAQEILKSDESKLETLRKEVQSEIMKKMVDQEEIMTKMVDQYEAVQRSWMMDED